MDIRGMIITIVTAVVIVDAVDVIDNEESPVVYT
jgi:hypothetical protein